MGRERCDGLEEVELDAFDFIRAMLNNRVRIFQAHDGQWGRGRYQYGAEGGGHGGGDDSI